MDFEIDTGTITIPGIFLRNKNWASAALAGFFVLGGGSFNVETYSGFGFSIGARVGTFGFGGAILKPFSFGLLGDDAYNSPRGTEFQAGALFGFTFPAAAFSSKSNPGIFSLISLAALQPQQIRDWCEIFPNYVSCN